MWRQTHQSESPRGLILGVTPELYNDLPWPDLTKVRAIDRTPEMVNYIWPGPADAAAQSDWREMPWADSSFDLALCDGGIHLLPFPDGQAAMVQQLARVISPGGIFTARLFLPPKTAETPDAVLRALLDGNIPNLNCLKLRLGMALQKSAEEGVALNLVWQTLRSVSEDWSELASQLGWSLDHLSAIDTYRDSAARYHFSTANQIKSLFCEGSGAFEVLREDTGSYEMSTQCPTVIFRRTDGERCPR